MMAFPYQYVPLPYKKQLLEEYGGKSIYDLPTPSVIIDRAQFSANSGRMLENAHKLNAAFRVHVKTHKTLEGARLQLEEAGFKTDKIVVSTLAEAWGMLPLIEEGLIKDVLFGLPVIKSRVGELAQFAEKVPNLRLMLDSPEQLDILLEYSTTHPETKKWSVFLKIDMGTERAGLVYDSPILEEILLRLMNEEKITNAVELYGFYCHAGHSYGSDSVNKAKEYLLEEIKHANLAAKTALKFNPGLKLQISVGATPTAHSSAVLTSSELTSALGEELLGALELHAGNYSCCDLQQVSTGCVAMNEVSMTVMVEVLSNYANRGSKLPGELLINAGVIALGREFGSFPGHGKIVEPKGSTNWIVGRLSQEHGILVPEDDSQPEFIPLGTKLRLVPQHACIVAAAHPWFFVVDGSSVVKDIWIPRKFW